ncbi:hypothetical protein PHYC_02310 [Phycisphaerales bacterium]|nr:hypothetical protein PHYC_02310 [Phycisphaerales bacterium]
MAGAPEWTPIPAGAEAEVVLKDGRRLTGLIVEHTRERVVLSINGISTALTMDGVSKVSKLPTVDERYKMFRDATDGEDVAGLIRLSKWLREKGRLDFALWEVDRALIVEPQNPSAKELRVQILAQQKVNDANRPKPGPDQPGTVPVEPAKPVFPLLTPEQINLMRVYEIDLKDPPKLIIARDVVARFLDKYAGRNVEGLGSVPVTPEARELFLRQRPADTLAWMFAVRAREFYPEVQVRENPRAMRTFVRDIHALWLTNTCATTRCHGGEDAGRLWLTNHRPGNDASAYTNFLILERFKTAEGLGLIDYDQPERSPLLDFALPRDLALFKHPEVAGLNKGKWRPAFSGRDDPHYQRAIDWVRSMYRPRTGYPIEYTPPKPRAEQPLPAPEGGR